MEIMILPLSVHPLSLSLSLSHSFKVILASPPHPTLSLSCLSSIPPSLFIFLFPSSLPFSFPLSPPSFPLLHYLFPHSSHLPPSFPPFFFISLLPLLPLSPSLSAFLPPLCSLPSLLLPHSSPPPSPTPFPAFFISSPSLLTPLLPLLPSLFSSLQNSLIPLLSPSLFLSLWLI